MDVIILTLVFLALELFLSRRRRAAMSEEIEEALGTRDILIESLRAEITDRFAQVAERAGASLEITTNLGKQTNSNRKSIEAFDKRTKGHFKALDALNNKIERAEKQIGTNKRHIAELTQDARRPPLGEKPSTTTKPHCYDGPKD